MIKRALRIGALVTLASSSVWYLSTEIAPSFSDEGKVRPARVEGTKLIVTRNDGVEVTGEALIGAVVLGIGPDGQQNAFRIDKIEQDPDDPEILLYMFSMRDRETSGWKPACAPDNRGITAGFPLSGSWTAQGIHLDDGKFGITCTNGAIGKCVRYGNKPWKTATDGRPMWDYHQACVRMLRADYCGNGLSHTRDGIPVDIIDQLGLMKEDPDAHDGLRELSFEAAWTPEGATCVAKTRLLPSLWSLDDIVKECPEKLQGRVGETCRMETEKTKKGVLFFNKS
jgi:hypothetical protein